MTLAEPEDVPEVNETNCYNSSDLAFSLVFTTEALKASATSFVFASASSIAIGTTLLIAAITAFI